MSTPKKIDKLTIRGFQSIKSLDALQLNDLNILIGANGAGKSNFVSYFRMLSEMVEQRLQVWVSKQGGADRVLSFGVKQTSQLVSEIIFENNGYGFTLEPTALGGFTFAEEKVYFEGSRAPAHWRTLDAGHTEAQLKNNANKSSYNVAFYVYKAISTWKVFHFHDTSETSGVKQLQALHDNRYLRPDASNLAAFLYRLRQNHEEVYNEIRRVVQLAIPFFDDFALGPQTLPSGEQQIRLMWNQRDSDYPFLASQLSDGSLRFICLVAALLQPNPPTTILIDEPELGLHPYAITLLGSLMRSAAKQMQIIVSTQSVPLLNEFSIDDLIVVEREDGASTFKRLDEPEFLYWLEDYSIGELWEKNVLGGRPTR
jgi:predicted ATPase